MLNALKMLKPVHNVPMVFKENSPHPVTVFRDTTITKTQHKIVKYAHNYAKLGIKNIYLTLLLIFILFLFKYKSKFSTSAEKCLLCDDISNIILNELSGKCECEAGYTLDKSGQCKKCYTYQDKCFLECPKTT